MLLMTRSLRKTEVLVVWWQDFLPAEKLSNRLAGRELATFRTKRKRLSGRGNRGCSYFIKSPAHWCRTIINFGYARVKIKSPLMQKLQRAKSGWQDFLPAEKPSNRFAGGELATFRTKRKHLSGRDNRGCGYFIKSPAHWCRTIINFGYARVKN